MSLEKLNKAFQEYKANSCEESLVLMYKIARKVFLIPNRGKLITMGYIDPNDADTIFDDVFWKLSKDREIKEFALAMRTSLRNARIDFVRSESSRRKKIEHYLDEHTTESEGAPTLVLKADVDVEGEALQNEEKKRTNQRQLIDSLLESAKILLDPTMIAVIEGTMRGETPNAIAKSLGLQRNTVDRKLRRLARNYDRKVHGDLSDYLPKSLRLRSEFISA
ncbi:hypothetical protein JNUCC32_31295 (plasmid) [Paenibacillus sp. JNUCC32]|uniref:hypothetical protein n=1 Tax=Paenibacillus sp. JNUCC32 TaxID=2777984 RepID=UPI001787C27B|nr:hypothetical protein [Paenibacillus sp. JNUCC-32]QOT13686.1 hypothetical protein JNUCC32_31295 [Paenibacillus sp. JNUCC-32]